MKDQQVVKRSRGECDKVMDVGLGEVMGTLGWDAMIGEEGAIKQGSDGNLKPSFRDMLVMEAEKAKHCVATTGTSSAPPKDRFGTWLRAPSRRSRKVSDNKLASNPDRSNRDQVKVAVSRFPMLDPDVNDVEVREMEHGVGDVGSGDVLVEVSKSFSVEDGGSKGLEGVDNAQEDNLVVIKVRGSEKRVLLRGSGSDSMEQVASKGLPVSDQVGAIVVVAKDVIIHEPIMLNADAHVAVRVFERGSGLATKKGAGRQSITGNLDRELESSGKGDKALSLGGDDHRLAEVDDVQWRENASFDKSLRK
ncbi:hypothetical protein V6N11_080584 [Hibiscus sabdariffa]|uniref:Uncharacterized protein n=1 Tax=Hibiscus sabdariffa TaxID=183260 RepID=A0ABR2R825_9ROSI